LANSYVVEKGLNHGGSNLSRWFLFRHDGPDIDYDFDYAVASYPTHAEAGQGWFYGPIIPIDEAIRSGDPEDPLLYILYGNFTDMIDYENYTHYGAYILTNSISYDDSDCCEDNCSELMDSTFNPTDWYTSSSGACRSQRYPDNEGTYTDKPFVIAPNFDASRMTDTEFKNENDAKTVFFSTGNYPDENDPKSKAMTTNIRFLGIEKLRDQFICDYYYSTGLGPNFLQRMMFNGYLYSDEENGLTSMYVEKEFLGTNDDYKDSSSADFEFMKNYKSRGSIGELYIIRGMPGCKSSGMCMGTSSLRRIIMSEQLLNDLLRTSTSFGLQCKLSDVECWGVVPQ
jgi:hypothetical protein